jgi:hypothetical protein
MALLENPNDAKADIYDIAEVIRRCGGRAGIHDFVRILNISEKRARQLASQAAPAGQYKSRVYLNTGDNLYHLRY